MAGEHTESAGTLGADRPEAGRQVATDVATTNVVPLLPATEPRNAGDAAEMRGSGIGGDAIEAMRAAPSQAERFRLLHTAVLEATKGPHRSRSAGGFSVALIAYLDHAMGLGNGQ
jgi:hypothetical protein